MKALALAVTATIGCGGGTATPSCPPGMSCADAAIEDASCDTVPAQAPEGYVLLAPHKIAARSTVRNRVIVLGTRADGSPADDEMLLSFDRPDTGAFDHPVVTLGGLGAQRYFSACNVETPGCVGPLTLTAALTSNPLMPVATLPIEIVDPAEVNPAKDCLGGGNTLYLKGNDQIFNGETTITNASWAFDAASSEYLVMRVTPAGSTGTWRLTFDLRGFATAMVPDAYEYAVKSISVVVEEQYDHPAMDVSGFGHECMTLRGRFDVVDYVVSGSVISNVTFVFEQHCEGNATALLRGCVHYQP